jgi:VCBS repeat-containing protein
VKHSLDKPAQAPGRRGLAFETLEPRLLLSADLAPALAPLGYDALPPIPAEFRALDIAAAVPQVAIHGAASAAHELVFVDASLPDRDRLVADVLRATGGVRPVEVILLDAARDGVAQVSDALATRAGLDAVHLVTHGGDGRLQLGATTLDADALAANREAIGAWGRAFAADGDLLLYGCDVAAGAQGNAFVDALARLTGADVAASDDATGARGLGGDWVLEYDTGRIAAATALSSALDGAWAHTLATETFDWDGGVAVTQPGGPGTAYTTGPVTLGTGTVSVTIQGYTHDGVSGAVDNGVLALLTGGTPAVTQDNTGGLFPAQNALQVTSSGFEPDDPLDPADGWQGFLLTIDFGHAGGVSNLSFSIFDADVGGGGGFIDELVVSSNRGAPTGTVDDAYNDVVAPGVVRGVGTTNSGASEPFGNARFSFAQSGITQVTIFYKNAGAPTTQGISLHDITFEPEVTVRDDIGATTENAALDVAGPGVLANDADNRPFAGAATPGATLDYDAAIDAGGNSAWTDATGVVGYDWQLRDGFGFPENASPAAAVTARPGITSAYVFGGALQEAWTSSFDALPGDPSDADASFELWVKPADVADDDILFEAGGSANRGILIGLDNDDLVFYMRDGPATSATVTADLTTVLGSSAAITGEYLQVVGVYDRDASGTTDALRLYVNGMLVGTHSTQTALNDWSGNDQAGLAGATGNYVAPAFGTWSRFEGAIARFRLYETALTDAEVRDNFNAIAEGLAVSAVNGQAVLPGAAGTTVALASGATVTMRADGSYTYNPNGAFNALLTGQTATDTFTYTATDHAAPLAHAGTATVTITINGLSVNAPPAIGGLGAIAYAENDAATVVAAGATVSDADSPDFGGGSLTASFAVNGTAADQLAIVDQGTGAGQIGVSGADVTYGGVAIGTFAGGANGTDLVVTFNTNATVAAAQALARNITFANTSENPSTAARTVRFTVADGDGGSAFADATVSVAAANDAPVLAGANALPGVAEDPATNAGAAVSALLAGQASDVDAGALYGIAVTAVDAAHGGWEYSTDGGGSWSAFGAPDPANARLLRDADRVRFVPDADWNGSATITFRAWDRTSGAFGGTGDTTASGGTSAYSAAVASAGVVVSPVGDAGADAAVGNEDGAIAVNVLANDSFENPGRVLTAVAGAANGAVAFDAAGNVTFTPNADWHGTETLTYTVTSGGVTETATLTLTIDAVADVADDAAATAEDTPITVDVLANDSFENGGRTLTAVTPAANGAIAFDAAGNVTYTPNADWHGAETLTYTVTSNGAIETGTLVVTVNAVADIAGDLAVTSEDAAATIDVVANDTFEGAAPTVSAVGAASNGVVAIVANQVVYTPNADFNGADAFTYTVTSGGASETATVTITVDAVNDAPTVAAAPPAIAVVEDAASALTGIAFADTDAGAGPLSATFTVAQGALAAVAGGGVAVGGTAGALTLTGAAADLNAFIAGGALTYTTALDATAPVGLTVVVNDLGNAGLGGPLASAPASVTLTVTAVNDAPVNTVPAAQAVAEDAALAFSAANGNRVTIADVDAGAALVDATLAVTNGTLTLGSSVGLAFQAGADGTSAMTVRGTVAAINAALDGMTYAPSADYNGPAILTITTDDRGATGLGGALTDSDVVGLAVTPVNDTPTIAAPPALAVTEDVASPVTGIVIGDIDGTLGPVSVTLAVGSGTLAAASGGGVLAAGSGTGSIALVGTTAAINAFIAGGGVTFTTAQDATAPVPLTAFVNDLGNFGVGGPLLSPTINVTLNVTAVNDAPLLGAVALAVDPLQSVTMTGANMSATDVDDPVPSLVFLVAGATNGRFELAGAPGVAVTSFTQAQVAAGQVRFVHTNATLGPSFSIFVTDGAAVAGPGIAVVSFRAPGETSTPAAKRADPPRADAPPGAGVIATNTAGLGDPGASAFLRTPAPGGEPPAATFAAAAETVQVAFARPVRGSVLLDPRIGGTPAMGLLDFGGDTLATAAPPVDFTIRTIRHTDDAPRAFDVALESARITGMALSVGAVWWAARAGGLIASMLASAPAWRHVDPLPVLGRDDAEPEIDWSGPEREQPEEEASATQVFGEGIDGNGRR